MLKFENISKSFRSDFLLNSTKVLDNLTFEIHRGSLCGFLGANGAGKTTSIKILFKFIRPDSGKITFDRNLGQDWDSIRRSIGYFPERPYFYPYLSARQFAHYIGRIEGLASGEIEERLKNLSERFNITHALDEKVKNFSKGMLQRLGLIVSIIHRPQILILDEPLSGLDPYGRAEFKNIFKELNSQGTTLFFSSHILSDIQEICDSLVVIKKGKLIFNGSTSELMEKGFENNSEIRVKGQSGAFSDFGGKDSLKVGNDTVFQIEKDKIREFLKKCLDNNVEIISIKPIEKTLEQIIYSQEENG